MLLTRYHYPSDTSDVEWALLGRLLPTPACQTPKGGAPEKWPRRRVVDSIRYITDNGAKWRALPADFGIPWRTVFGYFARWAKVGALKRILDQLRRRLRLRRRRCAWPVRVIVDSQSVKGAETVSNATRGYDANKHINGRKRHLIVDQDGLLVDLLVTPADVQDRDAARTLLTRLHAEHPEVVLVWADNGYGGEEFSTWAQNTMGITIMVQGLRTAAEEVGGGTVKFVDDAGPAQREGLRTPDVPRGSAHSVGLRHPHVAPSGPSPPPDQGGPGHPRSRLRTKDGDS
ncbi:IS5 family transposase [Streptomyces sp. NBC_00988]|uniref:IS5 family transposase n=1 Tax=Streptomyces sp. NBC_00988 TaxID=2903704 RepID=UPI00386BFC82|nr:IS5 family transposase [Streptomyces sp. NBC_00988]